jgi:hypothetical protein
MSYIDMLDKKERARNVYETFRSLKTKKEKMKLLYDNVDIIDLLERMYDNYELTGEMDL